MSGAVLTRFPYPPACSHGDCKYTDVGVSGISNDLNNLFVALLHNGLNGFGSSTVAIDNKIEQAMDLVKSHLMFAVREEVEVLKEQIAELIERNNQLEYENGILRAAASAETLAKLAPPKQQPPSSSS
ncbi:hypothetical protein ACF0H5_020482 [Mactra antiquata]